MVKRIFFILFLFVARLNVNAQDTTITFTKVEFQNIKYLKQALGDFPKDCKIEFYKMSMNLKGSEKVAVYDIKDPSSIDLPNAFIGILKKEGGELSIEKLRAHCASNRYNKSFKIIVK